MEKLPTLSLKRFRSALPWAVNLLFYGSILWAIVISELPPVSGPVFLMRKQFLAGNETPFRIQDPGLPYAIFEPYLPRKGSVTFLSDAPYSPEHAGTEKLQAAQGRLAPLTLNLDPVENIALVFCSQDAIAAARMQATGYRATRVLGDGKMIGGKRS
jgi:hypothetical protein